MVGWRTCYATTLAPYSRVVIFRHVLHFRADACCVHESCARVCLHLRVDACSDSETADLVLCAPSPRFLARYSGIYIYLHLCVDGRSCSGGTTDLMCVRCTSPYRAAIFRIGSELQTLVCVRALSRPVYALGQKAEKSRGRPARDVTNAAHYGSSLVRRVSDIPRGAPARFFRILPNMHTHTHTHTHWRRLVQDNLGA
jgi:hypothetical protein